MKQYKTLISHTSFLRVQTYLNQLRAGHEPGHFLKLRLNKANLAQLPVEQFLAPLIQTKKPQIFAESAVAGDGSDWNLTELGLLGDISMAAPVTFFDNGRHQNPDVHKTPFTGWLLFVAGALLRNGRSHTPADWNQIVTSNGQIDEAAYFRLYERRLLPGFLFINEQMQRLGKEAFITVPGLGCGMFAGPFQGQLGAMLQGTLQTFLTKYAASFSHIKAVYYDPYRECQNERIDLDGLSFLVRPLTHGNESKPQLCHPTTYEEADDDFSNCVLVSVVAWDHVSWPGNDFYVGSRTTDDGVKGAATDVTAVLTGIPGSYNAQTYQYEPPASYQNWNEVAAHNRLKLDFTTTLAIYPPA
ncbi:MAG: hypothetical protein DHS20C20_15740 [Ardenticatenaceae bacterium]|nr:MAG: hypothetical protein DHS20C20_15740 [Ardenticatenaceae bacterium]